LLGRAVARESERERDGDTKSERTDHRFNLTIFMGVT
jgi:hypothetical protein